MEWQGERVVERRLPKEVSRPKGAKCRVCGFCLRDHRVCSCVHTWPERNWSGQEETAAAVNACIASSVDMKPRFGQFVRCLAI